MNCEAEYDDEEYAMKVRMLINSSKMGRSPAVWFISTPKSVPTKAEGTTTRHIP